MTQTQEQLEKEFDEIPTDEINGQYGDYVNKVKVKRFIRQSFIPRNTVLEEIERRKEYCNCEKDDGKTHLSEIRCPDKNANGANRVLNDLKQALITNTKRV